MEIMAMHRSDRVTAGPNRTSATGKSALARCRLVVKMSA
jgi:hypothetical protein